MAPEVRLLTTGDARREFGFTEQTLRRWAKEGRIRHVRLPSGHVRFYREDLEALLQPVEPTVPPPQAAAS